MQCRRIFIHPRLSAHLHIVNAYDLIFYMDPRFAHAIWLRNIFRPVEFGCDVLPSRAILSVPYYFLMKLVLYRQLYLSDGLHSGSGASEQL